jgi:hypothetical protein
MLRDTSHLLDILQSAVLIQEFPPEHQPQSTQRTQRVIAPPLRSLRALR